MWTTRKWLINRHILSVNPYAPAHTSREPVDSLCTTDAPLSTGRHTDNTMTNAKTQTMPKFEVVSRVASIPIVESSIDVTEKVYHKIRESNVLIRWYLTLGEKSLSTGVALALPAVSLFESPLHQLDRFLCKSLDAVGERVPSIYLPPQELYTETRHYVLRRTESVKQLGEAVLDSRITAVTASALDRALSTADKYVDKILPPDQQDANDAHQVPWTTSSPNSLKKFSRSFYKGPGDGKLHTKTTPRVTGNKSRGRLLQLIWLRTYRPVAPVESARKAERVAQVLGSPAFSIIAEPMEQEDLSSQESFMTLQSKRQQVGLF
ncbi:perilipin family domain-containing protein [Phthorimaea operculella]|nr:perilipin family domain-containing protein [Phthorimaea operculella]